MSWSRPPLLLGLTVAASALAAVPEGLARLDRFARETAPRCISIPATTCFEVSFRFADADGGGGLSRSELDTLRRDVLDWTRLNRERLAPADRQGILATLAVIEVAGFENLFASYDTDRDGELSRQELLADVRLDERPLPQLAADPGAVDWHGLRQRLGPAALLLDQLRPARG